VIAVNMTSRRPQEERPMPKMTVTTNDGRFVADVEIGDVDPVDS